MTERKDAPSIWLGLFGPKGTSLLNMCPVDFRYAGQIWVNFCNIFKYVHMRLCFYKHLKALKMEKVLSVLIGKFSCGGKACAR